MNPIPTLIHQTWKDADIPATWRPWAKSWQDHHPGWTYRLWTDADNRAFLEEHYAWFLPIYDGYAEPIMRADAIRYFLLHHYGGLYVDFDCECIQPIDPLLEGKEIVLGLEPDEHLRLRQARERGFERIVGNAFMASEPKHPFWEHVARQLVATHRQPGPLDATGPFFLTRALDRYPEQDRISVVPAELLYPVTSAQRTQGPVEASPRPEGGGQAFAVHHWAGSWWRDPSFTPRRNVGGKIRVRVTDRLKPLVDGEVDLHACRLMWESGVEPPLVSCLMVTRARPTLAERAIRCFQLQSYRRKELIIIDDDESDALERMVRSLGDDRIRYFRLVARNQPLGELRNLSVEKASGAFVGQWDDDDLSDPDRIEIQMAVIASVSADACMLSRHQLWWPATHRLAVSSPRPWENSFLSAKSKLPRYPIVRKGEDTPVVTQVVRSCRVAVVDLPHLYTYVFHGDNTFDEQHFEHHWRSATEVYEGPAYAAILEKLATRLPIDLPSLLVEAAASDRPGEPGIGDAMEEPPAQVGDRSLIAAEARKTLILIPVRDAIGFLPRCIDGLYRLDYPHEKISIAFLEGDSKDGTLAYLEERIPELNREFRRAQLFKRDFGFHTDFPRWERSIQYQRRAVIAKCRNSLLSRALQDEDWVLWIDADVAHYPADVIQQLLRPGKGIIVPNCVVEPGGATFDLNTFVFERGAESRDWSRFIHGGVVQPPKGEGRIYLDELRDQELVRVDSLGGTMLMVNADIHREGLIFPPFSYKLYIDTEGLAMMAKDMGYSCWGMPKLEVIHPPHS